MINNSLEILRYEYRFLNEERKKDDEISLKHEDISLKSISALDDRSMKTGEAFLGILLHDEHTIPVFHITERNDIVEDNCNALLYLINHCYAGYTTDDGDKSVYSEIIIVGVLQEELNYITDSCLKGTTPWDDSLGVLLYVETKTSSGNIYYAPFFLLGKSVNQIQISYSDILDVNIGMAGESASNQLFQSKIFGKVKEGLGHRFSLLPLDTIIRKSKSEPATLFDFFVTACLEQNIVDRNQLQMSKLPAFKISGLHTKLGNNIHFCDFYYDSKMFQNSFFANSFAIEIAKHVLNAEDISHSATNRRVEIIGYAQYSEMVISETVGILNWYLKERRNTEGNESKEIPDRGGVHSTKLLPFGYNIIDTVARKSDREKNIESVAKSGDENDSMKGKAKSDSEKKLELSIKREYKGDVDFILVIPVSVTDYTLEQIIGELCGSEYKIDSSRIKLIVNIIRVEKSEHTGPKAHAKKLKGIATPLIQLVTSKRGYYEAGECRMCKPEKATDELPLIEVKKKYKTPIIFVNEFSFTGSRLEKYSLETGHEKFSKKKYDYSYHGYGSQVYGESEHLHYIDSQSFFNYHKDEIRSWLEEVRKNIRNSINPNKDVTLVAMEGNFNYDFANMINEIVFGERAYVIHHNTRNDFIENSKGFYQDIVSNSDLYYVDDLMLTGRTFMSFNHFIRQLWYDWDIEEKPFRGFFALIVRADDFSINQVSRELANMGKIHVFRQMRVPPLYTFNTPSPVKLKSELYLEIAKKCNLNSIRSIFIEKARSVIMKKERLQVLDHYDAIKELYDYRTDADKIKCFVKEDIKDRVDNRDLCKLLVTDTIFGMNAKDFDRYFGSGGSFEDLYKVIFKRIDDTEEKGKKYGYCEEEWKWIIVKVLSLPPFTYYSYVQSSIMRWMIELCEDIFESVDTDNRLDIYEWHVKYRQLRLLFSRLTSMKSNYLLREDTLVKLLKVNMHDQKLKDKWGKYRNLYSEALERLGDYEADVINKTQFRDVVIKIAGKKFYHDYKELEHSRRKGTDREIDEDIVQYYCQVIINYHDLKKVRNTYGTFFTSCIKEIIHDNEEKAIWLQKSLKRVYERLQEVFNPECIPKDRKLNKYSNTDTTRVINHLLTLIFLENIEALQVNTNASEIYKSKDTYIVFEKILSKVVSAFAGNGTLVEGSLTIRNKHEEGEPIVCYNKAGKFLPNKLFNFPQSFSNMMLKNVEDLGGSRQSFVCYYYDKQGDKEEYKSFVQLKSKYRIEHEEYREKGYDKLLFFQIPYLQKIRMPGKSMFDAESLLHDPAHAVIFVGMKNPKWTIEESTNYFDPLKLGVILMMATGIDEFLSKRVDVDTFESLKLQMKVNMDWNLYKHGTDRYFRLMRNEINRLASAVSVDDRGNISKKLRLFVNLVDQSNIIQKLKEQKELNKPVEAKWISYVELCNVLELSGETLLKRDALTVFRTAFREFKSIPRTFEFKMKLEIFEIIVAEVLVNVGKQFDWMEMWTQHLSFSVEKKNDIYYFVIENSFQKEEYQDGITVSMKEEQGEDGRQEGLIMLNDVYAIYASPDFRAHESKVSPNRYVNYLPLLKYKQL